MNTPAMHPPEAVRIGTSCFSLADIVRLLDELNRTCAVFSGTGLRMIYELLDNARELGPEASR